MWNKIKELCTKKEQKRKSDLWIFGTMLAFGIVSLGAAFVLTTEKFHLLENPEAKLSCSLNLVLNCSTVMQTWQSAIFGFPNMLIGLIAYPVVITVAVLGLACVILPRWFLVAANIGFGLGTLFSYWLFFQSVYAIEVLCPWCLIVTASTTLIFATMTHYNVRENIFGIDQRTHKKYLNFQKQGYGKLIVAAWLALLTLLVFLKFGDGLFA